MAATDDPAALLRDFLQIEDEDLARHLAAGLTRRDLAAGEILFREGEPGDDICFVLHGRLRAFTAGDGERLVPLGDIVRGETVGEMAFLTGAPRSATVIALRDSVLIRLSRTEFETVLTEHPSAAIAVMRSLARRLRAPAGSSMRPPRTICLVPVSARVDGDAIAFDLSRALAALGDRVRILNGDDLAEDGDATLSQAIETVEGAGGVLLLVTGPGMSAWARRAVAHADSILLLADAADDPAPTALEASLFEAGEATLRAGRMLVLLHAPEMRSPHGTARFLAGRSLDRHVHLRRGHDRDLRRLARLVTGRGIGVVLAGGGARGLAHIGALEALDQAGLEIDVIGGTSVGAVIASLHAMGLRGEALRDAAYEGFVANGNPVGDFTLPVVSLARGRRVRRVVESGVVAATGALIDIEDCWVPYFCVAADLSASAEVVLTRGSLAKSMLASLAIPGVLPPVVLDGHLHVDGGTVNNLPIDAMRAQGAKTVIAVDLLTDTIRSVDYEWVPPASLVLVRALLRRLRLARRVRVPGIVEIMAKSTILHALGRQRRMRAEADLVIAPALPGMRLLDWTKFDTAVAAGAEAAQACLAELDDETRALLWPTAGP